MGSLFHGECNAILIDTVSLERQNARKVSTPARWRDGTFSEYHSSGLVGVKGNVINIMIFTDTVKLKIASWEYSITVM